MWKEKESYNTTRYVEGTLSRINEWVKPNTHKAGGSRSPGDVILDCIWNVPVHKQWYVRGLKQERVLERLAAGMMEPELGN